MAGATSARVDSRPWLDDAYLALKQRLAGAPADAVVKGWLFHSVIESARRFDVDLQASRRFSFRDYAVTEYLELLAEAACRVEPERPPKDTLRVLGRGVYPSFAQSLFGKVILSSLSGGRDGARTGLRLVAQVYKRTSNHATITITDRGNEGTLVELSDVWSFPDSYHAGIFEGAAEAFGGRVSVSVQARSLSGAEFVLKWQE